MSSYLTARLGIIIPDTAEPTLTHRSPTDHRIFEQSTTNIWTSLSTSCKAILKSSGIDPALVKGVGFDATCSLAVVNQKGQPISVSRTSESEDDEDDKNLGREVSGEEAWNVILWADHRAEEEAEQINATGEGVLGFVGKTMSVSRVRGEKLSLTFSSRWRSQRRFGSASTWTRRSLRPVCFSSECFLCGEIQDSS